MLSDHYSVLGISHTAEEAEIKKAYRAQARKWHPDRNKDNVVEAKERFQAVAAAFEVLKDTYKRTMYDDDMRRSNPGTSGTSRSYGFNFPKNTPTYCHPNGPYFRPWHQNRQKPTGTSEPYRPYPFPPPPRYEDHTRTKTGHSHKPKDTSSSTHSTHSTHNSTHSTHKSTHKSTHNTTHSTHSNTSSQNTHDTSDSESNNNASHSIPKSVKRKLAVSLEDIYTGTTKRFKITTQMSTDVEAEKIVEVVVKPGCYAGTEIRIQNESEIIQNGQQQIIDFVVEEKPHDLYTREGDNLHVTLTLDLSDALIGFTKEINGLDQTPVTLTSDSVIQHGQKVRLNRRGMPNPETGRNGDLFVTYHILLPAVLSTSQKLKIMEALG